MASGKAENSAVRQQGHTHESMVPSRRTFGFTMLAESCQRHPISPMPLIRTRIGGWFPSGETEKQLKGERARNSSAEKRDDPFAYPSLLFVG